MVWLSVAGSSTSPCDWRKRNEETGSAAKMKHIALDTDAIIRLFDSGALAAKVTAQAKERGDIFVLIHVVKDQLAQTKDSNRRAGLLALYEALTKIEPTTCGLVLDISRIDHAEMRKPSELDVVTTTGRGKMEDAL